MYVLLESASGYVLLEAGEASGSGFDLAASTAEDVAQLSTSAARFAQVARLKAFAPFRTAADALENIAAVSEGVAHEYLLDVLLANLPVGKKDAKKSKTRVALGVAEPKLGAAIQEALGTGVAVESNERVHEFLRAARSNFDKLLGQLKPGDLEKAQRGLAHAYSRSKVKFNVHRSDNMIIQAIALLDQLDKDVNTFAMRVREWYSWHFPELIRIVPDNMSYAAVVGIIKNKSTMQESTLRPLLLEKVKDDAVVDDILHAARSSMGTDVSDIDMLNIEQFARRVVELAEYRTQLQAYLEHKMSIVAPNLRALIGDSVAARLISHAGSLTNLAKYPASTVQILGAEKALFRALKTKGKTPKYGLLFNTTYIGRAKAKNKGRISRYLANKCTIASRIDCFGDYGAGDETGVSNVFGIKLRQQVEDRLHFYETGSQPRRNLDVMKEAVAEAHSALGSVAPGAVVEKTPKKSKKKKDAVENGDVHADGVVESQFAASTPNTEERKKAKKRKADDEDATLPTPQSSSAKKSAKKLKKDKK
ncbi:Nucleolar protein 56 [Porphyridium purpureum]|uniref:Nucleolar protein 56 n=1 Tax=Porphyridium purpureum TaxID=35688 RepID=A0A5J4YKW8_PORPP|nr:Nucleolar protein 56 [Porphyridium purpureum]|eukprot:POR6929..scf244_11